MITLSLPCDRAGTRCARDQPCTPCEPLDPILLRNLVPDPAPFLAALDVHAEEEAMAAGPKEFKLELLDGLSRRCGDIVELKILTRQVMKLRERWLEISAGTPAKAGAEA
jgi:hypothetical protein